MTDQTTTAAPDIAICDPGGSGMFVPFFGGEDEGNWSKPLRAIIYGIIMCYCFLGAAIVSDFFMSAIEAITSKKGRRIVDEKKGKVVTYYVWNDTVANLTLLALGSSAPEILLSIVEVMKLDFKAGDLGPSTIVGSAAFNTLCIISVAILAIPKGEARFVKGNLVYNVTVVFAVMAYLWLLFIVQICSKDVVEVWEAVCTLLLFFILVVLAFIVDKYEEGIELKYEKEQRELEAQRAEQMLVEDLDENFEHHLHKKKLRKLLNPRLQFVVMHKEVVLQHAKQKMADVLKKRLSLTGGGPHHDPILGTGTAGLSQSIAAVLQQSPPAGDDGNCILDEKMEKAIRNHHGVLTFLCDQLEVKGCLYDTVIMVPVLRRNGAHGVVSCRWKLARLDAVPGCDYQDASGVLTFAPGTVYQEIEITILPQRPSERSEAFQLILEDPEGDCEFNPHDDGKEDACIMTISIVNSTEEAGSFGSKCFEALVDPEMLKFGKELWKEQISDAMQATDRDEPPATMNEKIMHCISLPWKMMFAIIAPPPVFLGGWVLFVVALCIIGFLTAIVADLAETFGCCLGLANTVTAIIVVAPGTSLPDLFASKAAAVADDNADASIVNVTGSNSVNVFLGIGLPWTIAALYWQIKGEVGANSAFLAKPENLDIGTRYPGGAFIVEAGSLSFSVIIFSSVSLICLGTLRIKRHLNGGELGGESFLDKQGVAGLFVFLWVWYLTWNIIKAESDAADVSQWISLGLAGIFVCAVIWMEIATKSGKFPTKDPSRKPRQGIGEDVINGKTPLVDAVPVNPSTEAPLNGAVEELDGVLADLEKKKDLSDSAVSNNVVGKPIEEDQIQLTTDFPASKTEPPGPEKTSNGSAGSGKPAAKKTKTVDADKRKASVKAKGSPKGKATKSQVGLERGVSGEKNGSSTFTRQDSNK